jgi:phosphoglycolate phosphatase-like HAD superfamily hydrolase
MPDASTLIAAASLVCFDNDGTLFASHEVANPAIQRCFVSYCREHGMDLPPPTDEDICRLTGKPGPEFYYEVLPEPLRGESARFRELCLEEEVREVLARGRLFDGIEPMLVALRAAGRRVVLVTNAGERYLGAVHQRVGYDRLLDGVYHFGKDGHTTKGEMIRSAMRDHERPDAVMVGDRDSDLRGARDAGVPFLGCLYGYGTREELAGADLLVPHVAGMIRALGLLRV